MSATKTTMLTLVALTLTATAVVAEDYMAGEYGHRYRAPYANGFYAPYGGYHASTALEGALRGKAAVIDAAGRFNRNTAEAAILAEQARTLQLENDEQEVVSYFNKKALNRDAREAASLPTPSVEDVLRYNQTRNPNRLSTYQLDPVSGAIHWPEVLRLPEFAAGREALQQRIRRSWTFERQRRYGRRGEGRTDRQADARATQEQHRPVDSDQLSGGKEVPTRLGLRSPVRSSTRGSRVAIANREAEYPELGGELRQRARPWGKRTCFFLRGRIDRAGREGAETASICSMIYV